MTHVRRVTALNVLLLVAFTVSAQGQAARPGQPAAAPVAEGPPRASRLDLVEGTKARYIVGEQLVGVSFGNDAVGTTESVTGTIALGVDGSINSSQSKISVDLRSLQSDQQRRDAYLQRNTLQTEQFPTLEFVPKRGVGLPSPLPAPERPQAIGFQLVGDMTLRGVTKEVTWNVVATVTADAIAGRATTSFPFATFNLPKPSIPLLLSLEDKIDLEIEFRAKRTLL